MSGFIALVSGPAAITATTLMALDVQSNLYSNQYGFEGGQRDAFAQHLYAILNSMKMGHCY